MTKILVPEGVEKEEIYAELEDEGIQYKRVSRENYLDELTSGDYQAVVGEGNDNFYAAAMEYDSDMPIMDYDDSGLATGFLSGNTAADLNCIRRMTEKYRKLVKSRELEEQVEYASSVLSHDARNELNVITGTIELVREEVDEEIGERLEIAESNTNSLLDIIDTTTNLLRSKNGSREIDLTRTLRDVYQNYINEANQNGFDMHFNVEPQLEAIAGPEVKNMYGQMVRNSFEHSNGDQIRLKAEKGADGRPRVVYEDNGKGIDDDKKQEVLKEGFSSEGNGAGGLGMYLMAQGAEKHDIDLGIQDSENLGGIKISTILEPAEE